MTIKEGNSTIAIRMYDGEDFMKSLTTACKNYKIESAVFTGIGMFRSVEIGYWNGHEYVKKVFDGLTEIVSLQGNISVTEREGDLVIHVHTAIALHDYSVVGGHLVNAIMYNGEIFIERLHNITLLRRDEPTGLKGLNPA
ncbi:MULTISPECIES: PPC domain-containing DNA-binding protein [Caldisericum]|uniref:DUF296 domain-containing protein n=1 Tax=Caldisericum exile TaxID=693075 RepID=A0A2J6WF59_9BACT|nr:MAG: DUF296 domain-containing protein [Caldisericum exile]PMP81858.1 MAG: DUF296 domain-containing protein [Caldisericum exile]HEM55387.1 DUF296 domain-containing protein [Thermodesulfobium narugense]